MKFSKLKTYSLFLYDKNDKTIKIKIPEFVVNGITYNAVSVMGQHVFEDLTYFRFDDSLDITPVTITKFQARE